MMEQPAQEGWVTDWNAFNEPDAKSDFFDPNPSPRAQRILDHSDPFGPRDPLEPYGEIIATFDTLWRRNVLNISFLGRSLGGEDGEFNGQTITIRRFDPFIFADPDEVDYARQVSLPLKDMYRAYFSCAALWTGYYSMYRSPFEIKSVL